MFSAIAISSPVTGGTTGDPVSHADAAKVSVPVQVLWHADDACSVTVPVNAYTLSDAFPNGEGVGLSGGFNPTGTNPCGATSYHGFLGIESCAVSQTTGWVDALTLAAIGPRANLFDAGTVSAGTTTNINLSGAGSPSVSGTLSYSLPFTTTSRGGTVSISGNTVYYTPAGTGADTFVYVVKESGGGTAFNVVKVNAVP